MELTIQIEFYRRLGAFVCIALLIICWLCNPCLSVIPLLSIGGQAGISAVNVESRALWMVKNDVNAKPKRRRIASFRTAVEFGIHCCSKRLQ